MVQYPVMTYPPQTKPRLGLCPVWGHFNGQGRDRWHSVMILLQFVQVVITLGIINAKWSMSRTPDQVTTPYSSQHSTTKYVRVSHGV